MGSHISPFAEIQDVGGLLTINGFTMLTIVRQLKSHHAKIFTSLNALVRCFCLILGCSRSKSRLPVRFRTDGRFERNGRK